MEGDTRKGRRRMARQHLAELYADIPPRRRAAFMAKAGDKIAKLIAECDPTDTKYDDKGRIAQMGTNKRDQAAIIKDMVSAWKTLGEISRDATEQHIAVTKLLHGIFTQQPSGKSGSGDTGVPLESLSTLRETVEHNLCPPESRSTQTETAQNSSGNASPTSDDSQD